MRQLSVYIPLDVILADLMEGWQKLSRSSQKDDDSATTNRRITCGELASFASDLTTDLGDLVQAIRTWSIWQAAFERSDDLRQQRMAKTFARETKELQEVAR